MKPLIGLSHKQRVRWTNNGKSNIFSAWQSFLQFKPFEKAKLYKNKSRYLPESPLIVLKLKSINTNKKDNHDKRKHDCSKDKNFKKTFNYSRIYLPKEEAELTEVLLPLGDTIRSCCRDMWLLGEISRSTPVALDEFAEYGRLDKQLEFGRGRIVSAREEGLKSVKL